MNRKAPVQSARLVAILTILTAAAFGGDFVDSRGPDPARDGARFPLWQLAELKAPKLAAHTVDLPPTRSPDIQADRAAEESTDFQKIGYVVPFDKQLLPDWPFKAREDRSAVAHVEFRSAGACGLRLRFENFAPETRIELRFHDANGGDVLGPFSAPRMDEDGGWWSPTIFGDTIGVELYAPEGLEHAAEAPEVTKVAFIAEYTRFESLSRENEPPI